MRTSEIPGRHHDLGVKEHVDGFLSQCKCAHVVAEKMLGAGLGTRNGARLFLTLHILPGPLRRLFAPNPQYRTRYLLQRAMTAQKLNKIKTPNRTATVIAISMLWTLNLSRAETSALRVKKC
jgi:hypothetical protein